MSLCLEGFRSVLISQINDHKFKGNARLSPELWQTLKRLLKIPAFALMVFWLITICWITGEKPWGPLSGGSISDKPLFYALAMYFLASQIEVVMELDLSYAKASGRLYDVVVCESITTILQAFFQLVGSAFIDTPGNSNAALVIFGIAKLLGTFSFFLLVKYHSFTKLALFPSKTLSSFDGKINDVAVQRIEPDARHHSFYNLCLNALKQCRRNFISTVLANVGSIFISFLTAKNHFLTQEKVAMLQGSYSIASQYGSIPSRLIHTPVSEAIKQAAFSRANSVTELSKQEAREVLSRVRLATYWALGVVVFGTFFKSHLLAILLMNKSSSFDALWQISHLFGISLFSLALSAILIPIETEISVSILKVTSRDIGLSVQCFDILSSICSIAATFVFSFFVQSPFDVVIFGSIFGMLCKLIMFSGYFRSLFPYPKIFFTHILPKPNIILLFLCTCYIFHVSNLQSNPFLSSWGVLIADCCFGTFWFLLVCFGMYA